jgi:prevent-host-death family protein
LKILAEDGGEAVNAAGQAVAGLSRTLGVSKARSILPELLNEAESGRATRVRKGADVAVVAPLFWLGEGFERLVLAFASIGLTSARPKLGELVMQAAAGPPLVLTRNGAAAAVLIADIGAPAPRARRPFTVPAGLSRPIVTAAEALDEMQRRSRPTIQFGLESLNALLGGLAPRHVTVVAGAPGTGGEALAWAVVHQAAVWAGRPVLYAVSGRARHDVVDSMAAARAGVSYTGLREGNLSAPDAAAVRAAASELSRTVLNFGDGDRLSAESIEPAAQWREDLALVVVDRFQHRQRESVTLSGHRLQDASRKLSRMAAARYLPVLIILDSADPAVIASLEADTELTVSRHGHQTRVGVAMRELGELGDVLLPADPSWAWSAAASSSRTSSTM